MLRKSLNIKFDIGQLKIVRIFDKLNFQILSNSKKSVFNFLTKSKKIKGIYLYGGVRGKSMLMDIFFKT